MRVTDEMMRGAIRVLIWRASDDQIHRALEAALADVPEPDDDYRGAWRSAVKRASTAEAKLAKVLAHAEQHGTVHVDVVQDILDGEP